MPWHTGGVGLDLAAGQLELKIQTQCRRGFRNRSIVGGRQPGGRVDEDEFFFDADGRGRRFVAASGGFGRAGGAHARVYPVGRRRKPTRGSPVLVGRTGPVVGLANISEASTSPCTPYESGGLACLGKRTVSDSVKRDPKACLNPLFHPRVDCPHALRRVADHDPGGLRWCSLGFIRGAAVIEQIPRIRTHLN